jgi:hypothetical protein
MTVFDNEINPPAEKNSVATTGLDQFAEQKGKINPHQKYPEAPEFVNQNAFRQNRASCLKIKDTLRGASVCLRRAVRKGSLAGRSLPNTGTSELSSGAGCREQIKNVLPR